MRPRSASFNLPLHRRARRMMPLALTLGDQVDELVEQVGRVVGAGAGLGVILHAEGRLADDADALDRVVIKVAVGHLDLVAVGGNGLGGDAEAVVLACNLGLARHEVLDRMVDAVVAVEEEIRLLITE